MSHRLLRGGRWLLRGAGVLSAAVRPVTRPQTFLSGSARGAVLVLEAPSRRERGNAS